MTVFVIIAVVMATVAVLCVLPPLLRRRTAGEGVARAASNLAVYRDQLAELDSDLRIGTLSPEQYAQAKLEIERRVLDEASVEGTTATRTSRGGRWTAAVLAAAIPFCAALLYSQFGNPGALLQRTSVASGQHDVTPQQIEAMVAKLAARLEQNPDDANGWVMLARSYSTMQRLPEAVAAYAKATAIVRDDANLLADYADALATSTGRNLEGRPLELVMQALQLDPNQWKALALAGTAAFDRKDYKAAVAYWEKLMQQLPPDSEFGKSMSVSIAEARQLGGVKSSGVPAGRQPATAASVRGTVRLSPALAGKVAPADTVFIFTRAAEGPRQPLAVVRRQAKDLPAGFTLDDSQAMSPQMKLSNFREVVVGALISKSGSAMPQSGDLQGMSQKVKVGSGYIAVVIDQVIP
jgi:cytochrome c-type biogenesis protein CcmH